MVPAESARLHSRVGPVHWCASTRASPFHPTVLTTREVAVGPAGFSALPNGGAATPPLHTGWLHAHCLVAPRINRPSSPTSSRRLVLVTLDLRPAAFADGYHGCDSTLVFRLGTWLAQSLSLCLCSVAPEFCAGVSRNHQSHPTVVF